MKYDDRLSVEATLQEVPAGELQIIRRTDFSDSSLLMDQLQVQTAGKGLVEAYSVFPGVEASFDTFLASEVVFRHKASASVMELFCCHSGRVGWNMQDDAAVYLGAGDMTVHSTVCCAHSAMMFPLGYAEGVSLSIDLEELAGHCPEILQQARLDFSRMQQRFCGKKPVALPCCNELEEIFAPLYRIAPAQRLPYLQLKVQELLLYLSRSHTSQKVLTQYFSQQTELIKEIHAQLTGHLEQRFTIEELSKQYAINTSTLKAVFKTVYGMPIASYMKEYRVRQAMKLLRESHDNIAQIAEQVGYESQGKFTNAFKDVAQQLPTEYRKRLAFSKDIPARQECAKGPATI